MLILTDACGLFIVLAKKPLFYYFYRLAFAIVKLTILFLVSGYCELLIMFFFM